MFFTRKDREDLCRCLATHKKGLEAHEEQILKLAGQVRDLSKELLSLMDLLRKMVDDKPEKKGKRNAHR